MCSTNDNFYTTVLYTFCRKNTIKLSTTSFPIKMPSFERFWLITQPKTAIPCGLYNNNRIHKTMT